MTSSPGVPDFFQLRKARRDIRFSKNVFFFVFFWISLQNMEYSDLNIW